MHCCDNHKGELLKISQIQSKYYHKPFYTEDTGMQIQVVILTQQDEGGRQEETIMTYITHRNQENPRKHGKPGEP